MPTEPAPPENGETVQLPAPAQAQPPARARDILFNVNQIVIVGATVFSPEQLAGTYSDLVGQRISLSELYVVANEITAKYAAAGYALSFALVPAQQIKDGVVRIQVIEGFVSRIVLENRHVTLPEAVSAYAWRVLHSRPLRTADLERYLLLANDIPGYTVRAVFDRVSDPNAPTGATQLILHVERRVAEATATVDNRGDRSLGSWRGDAFVSLRSVLGLGEEFQLHTLKSVTPGALEYISGLESLPIDDLGTRASISLSYSRTDAVSEVLAPITVGGTTWIGTVSIQHPFLRTRAQSFWITAGFTGKRLLGDLLAPTTSDPFESVATPDSDDAIYIGNVQATYLENDSQGGTSVVLGVNQGLPIFGATTSRSPERSRSSGSGVYTSVVLNVARQQSIWGPFDSYTSLQGQWANRGLLASEQCAFGGAQYGRAFDDSEITGDACVMGSTELRFSPMVLFGHTPALLSQVQFYGFYDAGILWEEGTLLPSEDQSQVGQSYGGGFRFGLSFGLSGSIEYAEPITHDVAYNGQRRGRLFASLKVDL